ncbi:Rab geranylgeranyltransferase [Coemansia spiralis]|uniref:Geranylgeranyl transferase type-2 subunit alpha n=2 Tax=Coemansia TaxID=4863 RepID=A0A9W8GC29_9FUNG|nr:hypothetical protein BX070DRAFT_125655 [Coemansia spiralis]KAJ1994074.1 Rab geranylgeranyltransferase [Coemansia umbellata]KAJ2623626.1 Rab geranylgeranyltransferase [Coemansia sp. RSA 1358]KAJ2680296.1 Rab geranylgeranyltransferase [Coemansia spiralis]
MHGRRRQTTQEPTVDEREQNKQRVEKYCALNGLVMNNRAQKVFSKDALETTKRLLDLNTELHTVWNYRREIFTHLDDWQDEEKRQEMLETELAFLLEIIMKNIKSYWMWNHRIWALQSLPRPGWERELGLVAKLLSVDARNFHGWDYRRFVVKQLKKNVDVDGQLEVDAREFAFTTEQINKDCANHAAWHNRSKLFPAVLNMAKNEPERQGLFKKEFDMILNAIYTDPDDQNAWLYYDWLLGIQENGEEKRKLLRDKVATIRELLELEEDSKWPMIELVGALIALEQQNPGSVTSDEKKECLDILSRLKEVDTYHIGRYKDMSKTMSQQWGGIC